MISEFNYEWFPGLFTWTEMDRITIPMNPDVTIGMVVCATNNDALNTAVLDDIILNAAPYEKPWDLTPKDGATKVSLIPTLTWLPGDSATSHEVRMGTEPADLSVVATKSLGDESYTPDTPLLENTWYYWQIVEQPLGQSGPIMSFKTMISRIFVDIDATGANNGSSWADAYNYLQDALTVAQEGTEIKVAQGEYRPDQGVSVTSGDRTATFGLINGVTISGGYAGFGEPDPNARDIELYETILSGDLSGDDQPDFVNNGENSYHVVTSRETEPNAILDGFTITAGNANGAVANDNFGGGMYNYGSPTVTDCTFSANSANNNGGGMFNILGSPKVTNCTFNGNSAGDSGGGMDNYNYSSPILTNCTFIANQANSSGGGLCNYNYGSPTLTNCSFSGNSADFGGGMYNRYFSDPTLTNCIFSGNSAVNDGGAMYIWDSCILTLSNCSFSQNSALNGAALACDDPHNYNPPSTLEVTNCILWDGGGEIWNDDGSTITINYSDVEGGWTGLGGNNINADPLFVDPCNHDYHLKSQAGRWNTNTKSWVQDDTTSPGIEAGDTNSDWTAELWPHGKRINMGAYGGTPEASMSLSNLGNIADLNHDDRVDFNDYAYLAGSFQIEQVLLAEDLDRSGRVDFNDVNTFTHNWLWTAPYYALSASVIGGRGTVTPTSGTYYEGTTVMLTATPDLGWEVYAWNGTNDDSSKSTSNTVTMYSDKTVTVEFISKHEIPSSPLKLDFEYYTGIINMNLVSGATCELFHVGFILDSSLPSFYSNPTFFLEPGGVYFPTPFGFGPVIVYSEPLFVSVAAGTFPPVSGPAMIVGGLLAVENGWEEGDVWLTLVVVEDSLMDDQTVPAGTVLDRVYIRWAEPVWVIP